MIKIMNVNKLYTAKSGATQALKDINLEINDGEFVVILGPSGSGKSTLLNVMSGLDSVSNGTIIVDEENITNKNEEELTNFRRRKLGFIFQSYNLLSNLTVYENVEIGAHLSYSPIPINELLSKINMFDKRDKYPHELSGGEQQRVSIARALAKNPSILFCDEPTGALDEVTGNQVLEVLRSFNKDLHKTIILVTHHSSIKNIADKVIYMKNGLIDKIESQ